MKFINTIIVLSITFSLFSPINAQTLSHEDVARQFNAELNAKARTPNDIGKLAPPPSPVRNIAEYEPMEGVLIRHPLGIPYNLIKEMAEDVIVYCITTNPQSVESEFSGQGINMNNVEFLDMGSESIWTRDYGPWWIVDGNGDIGISDHSYYANQYPNNNAVPGKVGTELGVPVYKMELETTGGNYMTDGYGISASTNSVWDKNPGYTHAEIDEIVKEYLGVNTNLVIEDPLSSYINHIDCWGKFVAPDKIVLLKLPTSNSDYNAVEQVVEYFEGLTSSYGTPYKIYRVETSGGNNEGYINCTILNNKVLVPTSGTSNDAAAIAAFEEAMPGYEVIGFSAGSNQWLSSDALHCRTKGIPDRGMLYVGHIPLHDTVPDSGDGFSIEATIIPYSNEDLVGDSVVVYYTASRNRDFTPVKMSKVSGDTFNAVIPSHYENTEIAYYIHAEDQSGRSENHPYIGTPDAHTFFGLYTGTYAKQDNAAFNTMIICNNYPNPFISRTKIAYTLKAIDKNAKISIHNNKGRLIREWAITMPASYVVWDGTDKFNKKAAAGIYFYRVTNGNMVITKQMQLIK